MRSKIVMKDFMRFLTLLRVNRIVQCVIQVVRLVMGGQRIIVRSVVILSFWSLIFAIHVERVSFQIIFIKRDKVVKKFVARGRRFLKSWNVMMGIW